MYWEQIPIFGNVQHLQFLRMTKRQIYGKASPRFMN